jgi:hypothetical protein
MALPGRTPPRSIPAASKSLSRWHRLPVRRPPPAPGPVVQTLRPPGATRVADLLAHMDYPPAHWRQIRSTNGLERLHREIARRPDVVGVFPHRGAVVRLAGALLAEQGDEGATTRRYFRAESMAATRSPHLAVPHTGRRRRQGTLRARPPRRGGPATAPRSTSVAARPRPRCGTASPRRTGGARPVAEDEPVGVGAAEVHLGGEGCRVRGEQAGWRRARLGRGASGARLRQASAADERRAARRRPLWAATA